MENKSRVPALARTPLWSLHGELGAKMAEFAGYDMPIHYPEGVLKEHLHTRTGAGLFDVSHMGQALLTADSDPAVMLERLIPGDIINLAPGKTRYTLLLNERGGVIDDLMVTRLDETTLYLVVNAGCKHKDFDFIEASLPTARLHRIDDRALLALQGPAAEQVLEKILPGVADLKFMHLQEFGDWLVTRSGYTGEDGFEISLPATAAEEFFRQLIADDRVKPIGLGARDSLRLEAGLCLYGQDLNEDTTPIEAGLNFAVSARRRAEGGFNGDHVILDQLKNGPPRLRVGLKPQGRAPVRAPAELFNDKNEIIGTISSGGFSPSLNEDRKSVV